MQLLLSTLCNCYLALVTIQRLIALPLLTMRRIIRICLPREDSYMQQVLPSIPGWPQRNSHGHCLLPTEQWQLHPQLVGFHIHCTHTLNHNMHYMPLVARPNLDCPASPLLEAIATFLLAEGI